jgi:hypothetical protein
MSYTFSFYIDPDLLITVSLLMFLALGIAAIALGSYLRSQAFSRPPGKPRRGDAQRWQQLLKWQVIQPGYHDPALLDEFSRSHRFIQSAALIGAGLALVLAVIGSAIISVGATGTLLNLSAGNGSFLSASLFFVFLIGFSLGYVSGVWQLRSLTARRVAYGDLKPRRLSDYRSVLFPCIAGAPIIGAILIPLLFVPAVGAQIPLSFLGGSSVEVPGWVLQAIAAAMLLTLVTGEIVMARVAKLPRLLLTSNPQTAQRADNLLRAMTISTVQGLELAVIGYLGIAQWNMIVQYFWQVGFWHIGTRPDSSFLDLLFFFAFAAELIGLGLPCLASRIGGHISRWPWQPMRTP